jgi:uncharacterized protein (TIGR04255 family)
MAIGKLKAAPVFYTVCQLRHNAVLGLPGYIAEIQEKLRKSGYPDYHKIVQMQMQMQIGAASLGDESQPKSPAFQQVEMFYFGDASSTTAFTLQPTSISFETTNYDSSGTFFACLLKGLEVVNQAVGGLDFIERIGLRYIDAIVPRADQGVRASLTPEMHGLLGRVQQRLPSAALAYSYSEATFSVQSIGEVTARSVIQSGPLQLPIDLSSTRLKLPQRVVSIKGEHAVLDTDAFFAQRMQFDFSAVQEKFEQLHELAGEAFTAAVTAEALESWRQ